MLALAALLSLQAVASTPDSIVYKHTPQGKLTMYFHYPPDRNDRGKCPAILFFHGGSWTGGGPGAFTKQAEYLASRGMVVARVEYRLLSKHGTRPDKCVEDGKSAVRWVRVHARELGVDPARIVAAGGSAGGHVAACASLIEGFEAEGENLLVSSQPDLLVLFNPAMVTTSNSKMINIMDSRELAEALSPNSFLSRESPPMILFFGTKDFHLRGAYETIEIADSLGIQAELWIAEDQGHGFFKNPPWYEWTLYLTDRFLVRHGFLADKTTIIPPDGTVMKLYQSEKDRPIRRQDPR